MFMTVTVQTQVYNLDGIEQIAGSIAAGLRTAQHNVPIGQWLERTTTRISGA